MTISSTATSWSFVYQPGECDRHGVSSHWVHWTIHSSFLKHPPLGKILNNLQNNSLWLPNGNWDFHTLLRPLIYSPFFDQNDPSAGLQKLEDEQGQRNEFAMMTAVACSSLQDEQLLVGRALVFWIENKRTPKRETVAGPIIWSCRTSEDVANRWFPITKPTKVD